MASTFVAESRVDVLSRVKASKALALYYVQLGLNLLWTPLFFVKKKVRTSPSSERVGLR